jgi:hypothetical protein
MQSTLAALPSTAQGSIGTEVGGRETAARGTGLVSGSDYDPLSYEDMAALV